MKSLIRNRGPCRKAKKQGIKKEHQGQKQEK